MDAHPISVARNTELRTPLVIFMALAAAIGTASIYPLQPSIADVAGSLHASIPQTGVALACGPVGYLVGLTMLVPLVDRFAPRRVVSVQFGTLAVILGVCALASTWWALGLVIGAIGVCSSVGAQLSSIAGRFANPRRRAAVLGLVTAGISGGILGGRMGGGWLSHELGWRGMLLVFAAAAGCVGVISLMALPKATANSSQGYLATVRSLPGLYARSPVLRLAAGRGALWFFAFCAMWAALAVALSQPPFSYTAAHIGTFAAAGLLGIVATRVAGTWTDRVGATTVIVVGLVVALAAAMMLAAWLSNTVVVVACLALFDAGLFAAQVANQSTVLAIDSAAPARFNSAYMVVYFIGGSAGSAFGAAAVPYLGWSTTAAVAAAAIALAAAVTAAARWHRVGRRAVVRFAPRRVPRRA